MRARVPVMWLLPSIAVLVGVGCVGGERGDAGLPDAGDVVDSGAPAADAGPRDDDAGARDAGALDAGAPDAGEGDAGEVDAGPPPPEGPDTDQPFPIDRGDDPGTPGSYLGLPLRLVDNEVPAIEPVDGVIGLLCIGGEVARDECEHFAAALAGPLAGEVNPAVKVVNCGITGFSLEGIEAWNDPAKDVYLWDQCLGARLSEAGVTREQVRVVYHRAANFFTAACGFQSCIALPPYPEEGNNCSTLVANLDTFTDRLLAELPDLAAVYTSSRPYGGFTKSTSWRGEPLTYEEGHGVNTWLAGSPARDGVAFDWGPYLWAPDCASGETNGAGLCWEASDFDDEGELPTASGLEKVTSLLHARFLAESWYAAAP